MAGMLRPPVAAAGSEIDGAGGTAVTEQGVPREPGGEVYDWFVRGLALLESGNAEAAAELLAHARSAEPGSASILEALARATFDAGRFSRASELFAELAEASPDNDYARFGLGLTRMRVGDVPGAVEQLAMAAAMRPGRQDYQRALREARATLAAREEAGLPGTIGPDERAGQGADRGTGQQQRLGPGSGSFPARPAAGDPTDEA
jgi:tetratricopeptide (TPR) repeat protein